MTSKRSIRAVRGATVLHRPGWLSAADSTSRRRCGRSDARAIDLNRLDAEGAEIADSRQIEPDGVRLEEWHAALPAAVIVTRSSRRVSVNRL